MSGLRSRAVLALVAALTLPSAARALPGGSAGAAAPSNVLLLLADDVGVDQVAAYGIHPDPAHTPRLDQLAAEGVLFRNAWANPLCSPTRGTILTGRYAFRTRLGNAIEDNQPCGLPLEEVTLPEVLPQSYRTAALGKWHLGPSLAPVDPLHALKTGFDHHWGTLANIPSSQGLGNGFFDFWKHVDGLPVHVTTYATTDTVNDALLLIDSFAGAPWFVMVSFHAAHTPIHAPPAALHTYALPAHVSTDKALHYRAMVEAMDTEIGRLLDSLDPAVRANTLVLFVGDNGTSAEGTTAPFSTHKAKKTVYEGGIHVPLIAWGAGVTGGQPCEALVNTTDLCATVAEACGVAAPASAVDSVSLLPYLQNPQLPSQRAWIYSELFTPNGPGTLSNLQSHHRAVRGPRYKLIYEYVPYSPVVQTVRFYDLVADPFENADLLSTDSLSASAASALAELSAVVAQLLPPTWVDVGSALAGTQGKPRLKGQGTLLPLTTVEVRLDKARADAPALIVLGPALAATPFYGGTLVTWPTDVVFFVTDGDGKFEGSGVWPADLPPQSQFVLQAWIADPAGPQGFAASNGLMASAP